MAGWELATEGACVAVVGFAAWCLWFWRDHEGLKARAKQIDDHPVVRAIDRMAKAPVVVIAGIVWVITQIHWWQEGPARAEARHNQAWSLILQARGVAADSGRVAAIEGLYRDAVPLAGLPLNGSFLTGLDLRRADLRDADFQGARLIRPDFSFANLTGAKLDGLEVDHGSFERATIFKPSGADAQTWLDVRTTDTSFSGVSFRGVANSRNAIDVEDLRPSEQAALFHRADFTDADLRDWFERQGSSIRVLRPDDAVLAEATLCRTRFAYGLSSDLGDFIVNRDCLQQGLARTAISPPPHTRASAHR